MENLYVDIKDYRAKQITLNSATFHLIINKKESELTFAKTSGTFNRDKKKLANS